MPNIKYDWEEIIKEMADVISNKINEGYKPPKIHELYNTLKYRFQVKRKPFPTKQEIFTRKIHSYLGLEKNKKNYESYFYRLVARYDRMTLDILSTGLSVTSVSSCNNSNWLFIRVNRIVEYDEKVSSFTVVQKHLYLLSHELKKKFSKEIIFISFDKDTLVVLCRDNAAQQKVKRHFSHINTMTV